VTVSSESIHAEFKMFASVVTGGQVKNPQTGGACRDLEQRLRTLGYWRVHTETNALRDLTLHRSIKPVCRR